MKRSLDYWLPNPLSLLGIITIILLSISCYITSFAGTINSWMNGYLGFIHYTMQAILVFLSGYMVAIAPPVAKMINKVASIPKTVQSTILVLCITSAILTTINWVLPIVAGGLLANAVTNRFPEVPKRIFVVAGISGFALMHIGLSATIALLSNTPGHMYENIIGLVPITNTIFSFKANIIRLVLPLVFAGICILQVPKHLRKSEGGCLSYIRPFYKDEPERTFASFFDSTYFLNVVFSFICLLAITFLIKSGSFSWNLNTQIITVLGISLLLYKNPTAYSDNMKTAIHSISGMILQYPLYGALQAVLISSGLAIILSNALVAISSINTLQPLTYLGFILGSIPLPSAVGSWTVQGIVFINTALELGVSVSDLIVTVGMTKGLWFLICPFWTLPILIVTGISYVDLIRSSFPLFISGSIAFLCIIYIL